MIDISIIGSTGSIGVNTVELAKKYSDRFRVRVLAANRNIDLLEGQFNTLHPELICVYDEEKAEELRARLKGAVTIVSGDEGLMEAAGYPDVKRAIFSLSGSKGLKPLLRAIERGKDIAIANKEVLVIAGDIIKKAVKENDVLFVPIDSEHSAIFQCLEGHKRDDISRIILTASGGPFIDTPLDEFKKITKAEALNHPKWSMGQKITIDSATMMNKGLEVIEAARLYDVPMEKIEAIIHRQSIIHSFVEYFDGSMLAQLSDTHMAFPIMYALGYPERMDSGYKKLNLAELSKFTFEDPDFNRFPCLALAYRAGKEDGTMTTVLNAANEAVVESFLKDKISFYRIPEILKQVMDMHETIANPDLDTILKVDEWAREEALKLC